MTIIRSRHLPIVLSIWFVLSPIAMTAEPLYRPVSATDLLQGYVKTGESIAVEGHAWVTSTGVFLNFNRASAQFPARVDISKLDPGTRDRLAAQCSATSQFAGGCRVRVRGQVGDRDQTQHRVLIADELQLLP